MTTSTPPPSPDDPEAAAPPRGPSSARVLVVLGNLALNGQERGNIEVYRALAADGVDALFVTHATWGDRFIQPYLDRLGLRWTTLEYARHVQRSLTPLQHLRNLGVLLRGSWRFWRIARRYRPTHVHVANPHYFLCVLPALLVLRVPVVYRSGDLPPRHHAFYRGLLRWFIIPRTRAFVCISSFVRDTLVSVGVPERKVRVIRSVPPTRPPASNTVDLGVPEAEGPGRTVVFVGQVSEHKGVHHLVEAAALLRDRYPDLRVYVAGRPPSRSPFTQDLLARAAATGGVVRFLGYVEDVEGLLAVADVHAVPSIWGEPLGNVVQEAKRAGVPSVVYPDGGLPELVAEPGVDGLVCAACTPEALASGLDHFLAMDAARLTEAGRAAARSLDALGITEPAFRAAWRRVLDETAR